MSLSKLKQKIKQNKQIHDFAIWIITPQRNPKPRLWVKFFLNPLVHSRGKGSIIRRPSRMDVFPWKQFRMGKETVIETFATVNNGAGDVILDIKTERKIPPYSLLIKKK